MPSSRMVLNRLRFLCLYLTTSRLKGLRPISSVTFPFSTAANAESTKHIRLATRNMATASSDNDRAFNVGQADIGRENEGESFETCVGSKSWRTLLEASSAKSRKIRGSNYVQLATVDPKTNEPRCRTVVFRGFQKLPEGHSCHSTCDGLSCVMKMITDNRSKKVDQVMEHPAHTAELLWWFPKTSEQYRIRGELLFVGGGQFASDDNRDLLIARTEMWGNISDSARESFLTKEAPGQPYSGESDVPEGGRDSEGKVLPPPDTFLLMLLIPKHCHYLRLTDMYSQKDDLREGEWQWQRLNP